MGGRLNMNDSGNNSRRLSGGLKLIYEDRDILVVNKPVGLLTIATEREKSRTAYYILTDYVRKGYSKSRNRIFVVHRLDRDTSGVLVFAKSEDAKMKLQGSWDSAGKKYLAVVHGHPPVESDTIVSYLAENRANMVYSTKDQNAGKLAKTLYRVIARTREYSLLEIDLLTGRKNQIRVHMADIGCPVVGDRKYGREEKKRFDLALHSKALSIIHPYNGRRMTFEADPPPHFQRLVPSGAGIE